MQPERVAGSVGPASAPVHGKGVHACFGLQLERVKRLAVGGGAGRDGELQHDLVRLAYGRGEDGMYLFALLDHPHHLHRAVGDGLGGRGEVQEAPKAGGVLDVGGGQEDPALEAVAHLVHHVLDCHHLAGQPRVVVEQGRVGEPDGHLREVLHLYEDVHRVVDLGELARGRRGLGNLLQRGGAGELPDLIDALGRALQKEHVARPQHVLGLGVEVPLVVGADGDGAHPRLYRQIDVAQRAAVEEALRLHTDAGGDLLGLGDVVQQLGRDAEALHHYLGYVHRGVADLLDVLDDAQNPGHLLGVGGAPRGQDGQGAHVEDEVVQHLLQAGYLLRERLRVVEDRRVGKVHHELRGVLRLDEHLFQVPWSRLAHLLPRQSENDEGYYKAHKAEQVHRRRDNRDAVGVRVQTEPVAEGRAVICCEDRRRGGDQASKGADPDHRQKARTRPLFEERHGYKVRGPTDEHVNTSREDVGERE